MTPATTSVLANPTDHRSVAYQQLKSQIHQELLNRLNLDRLAEVKREEGEPEIRGLVTGMLDNEYRAIPLNLQERESLVTDVLNELFGLGPLEPLLKDSEISDILVNRFDQVYVERNGKLSEVRGLTAFPSPEFWHMTTVFLPASHAPAATATASPSLVAPT